MKIIGEIFVQVSEQRQNGLDMSTKVGMNLNQLQIRFLQNYEKNIIAQDIRNFLPETIKKSRNSEQELRIFDLRLQLSASSYKWVAKRQRKVLILSKIGQNLESEKLLRALLIARCQIGHFCIYDSMVSQYFFNIVAKSKVKVFGLSFKVCRIGQRLPLFIKESKMELSHLEEINIYFDNLGNKGAAGLLKLNIGQLKIMRMIKTQITADFAKVLKKKRGLFQSVEICEEKFGEQSIFREMSLFDRNKDNYVSNISQALNIDTIFYPFLSKKAMPYSSKSNVFLCPGSKNPLKGIYNLTTLTSEKSLSTLEQMIV